MDQRVQALEQNGIPQGLQQTLQQMHQTLQQMQQGQQALQQGQQEMHARMSAIAANAQARRWNVQGMRVRQLVKETPSVPGAPWPSEPRPASWCTREGVASVPLILARLVVGAQPPVQYGINCDVTHADLNTLELFYNETFPGPSISARRDMFVKFVFSS